MLLDQAAKCWVWMELKAQKGFCLVAELSLDIGTASNLGRPPQLLSCRET